MSGWYAKNRHRYPANWTEIANRVKAAAQFRCEACGSPSVPGRILTTHHLDHEPSNCADANLLACCQVCHLRLGPHIYTKEQAIAKLRRRHELEQAQLVLL